MSNISISIFSLALASLLPMTLAILLPKRSNFYKSPIIQGFGLGVYSALIVLLVREGVEHSGAINTVIWFIAGLMISIGIGIYLKEFHHHHNEEERVHSHSKTSITRILVSDFFHNIVDGIAIVSGFGISNSVGLISLLGVVGHQMIQQAGQQVLLVENGISPKKALTVSFLVSLSLILGYFLSGQEVLEHILIPLSAGIVAWKIGTDILHSSWSKKSVFGFFVGAILLTITLILIPHGH